MRNKLFGEAFDGCGGFITFAEDSSIILRGLKGEDNSVISEIDSKLISISDFLAANNLKLNVKKTQLLRTASRQQHVGNKGERIMLKAKSEKGKNIIPTENATILGLIVSKNLT